MFNKTFNKTNKRYIECFNYLFDNFQYYFEKEIKNKLSLQKEDLEQKDFIKLNRTFNIIKEMSSKPFKFSINDIKFKYNFNFNNDENTMDYRYVGNDFYGYGEMFEKSICVKICQHDHINSYKYKNEKFSEYFETFHGMDEENDFLWKCKILK